MCDHLTKRTVTGSWFILSMEPTMEKKLTIPTKCEAKKKTKTKLTNFCYYEKLAEYIFQFEFIFFLYTFCMDLGGSSFFSSSLLSCCFVHGFKFTFIIISLFFLIRLFFCLCLKAFIVFRMKGSVQ